jgi:nickel-type superoxide dismutase maturation protease
MKELPEANIFEIGLIFLGKRFKYLVEGNSMLPLLKNGDLVLVAKDAEVKVGDIVIAKHPLERNSELIKRIERINEHGHYFLVGDNLAESNDSRHFGAVAKEYIKGKVVGRLS